MPGPDAHVWAQRALFVSGLGAVGVACFHGAAIIVPTISEPSPPWRHALFIGVNLFFGFAFLRRARWLPVPFAVLSAQQVYSHGTDLIEARAVGHTDLQSLAVLATLPVLAVLVALGRVPRRAGS